MIMMMQIKKKQDEDKTENATEKTDETTTV